MLWVSPGFPSRVLAPLSPSFSPQVRSTVSDFAVFLTIVIMVLIDLGIGIPSPKLHVPHMFKVTGLGIGGEGFWHLRCHQGMSGQVRDGLEEVLVVEPSRLPHPRAINPRWKSEDSLKTRH